MGMLHSRTLQDLGFRVTTVDPQPGVADYRTIMSALDASGPFDVAAVAAPIDQLADCAYDCAGMRMLVEKPFADDVGLAREVAHYLAQIDAPVCVGFTERFNPVVRQLHEDLDRLPQVLAAKFVRWSDRPSPNPALDLLTHDVDLAWFLGINDAGYDTRCEASHKARLISLIFGGANGNITMSERMYNLMNHESHPLVAMWHAFLSGQDHPKPEDAVRALERATALWPSARTA